MPYDPYSPGMTMFGQDVFNVGPTQNFSGGNGYGYGFLNQGGAGWSIPASYLTPGYVANMRPSYGGNQGFSPYSMPMSVPYALNQQFNPVSRDPSPFYFSSTQYDQAMGNQAAGHAVDRGMSFGQSFAVPIAASMMASAALNYPMGRAFGFGATGATNTMLAGWHNLGNNGFFKMLGANPEYAAGGIARMSISGAMGHGIGRGIGGMAGRATGGLINGIAGRLGMSGVNSALMGARAASFVGAAGYVAGSMAMPLIAGQAMVSAADTAFFDPYISASRGADAFMQNSASTYMGINGNRQTGIGASSSYAMRVGTTMMHESIKDMGFEGTDMYGKLLDYGMKNNMFGNIDTGKIDRLKKRVGEMASQVRMLMAITGDPNVEKAVEQLGQFMNAGAVGAKAVSTMGSFKFASAASGVNANAIIQGIGSQAQYLYQASGFSPFVGQQNAATMFAGFAAASKTGLMSPAAMAMLGGQEGATQYAMQAQIGLAGSMYNRIGLYNQATGRGASGVVNTLTSFGQGLAGDPLNQAGMFFLSSNHLISDQLEKNPLAPMQGIYDRLNIIPGAKKNGKYGLGATVMAMKASGMGDQEIYAMVKQLQAVSDPASMAHLKGSAAAAGREGWINMINGYGGSYQTDDWVGKSKMAFRGWGQSMMDAGGYGTAMAEWKGEMQEAMGDTFAGWRTGQVSRVRQLTAGSAISGSSGTRITGDNGSFGRMYTGHDRATATAGYGVMALGAGLSSSGLGAVVGIPLIAAGGYMVYRAGKSNIRDNFQKAIDSGDEVQMNRVKAALSGDSYTRAAAIAGMQESGFISSNETIGSVISQIKDNKIGLSNYSATTTRAGSETTQLANEVIKAANRSGIHFATVGEKSKLTSTAILGLTELSTMSNEEALLKLGRDSELRGAMTELVKRNMGLVRTGKKNDGSEITLQDQMLDIKNKMGVVGINSYYGQLAGEIGNSSGNELLKKMEKNRDIWFGTNDDAYNRARKLARTGDNSGARNAIIHSASGLASDAGLVNLEAMVTSATGEQVKGAMDYRNQVVARNTQLQRMAQMGQIDFGQMKLVEASDKMVDAAKMQLKASSIALAIANKNSGGGIIDEKGNLNKDLDASARQIQSVLVSSASGI